VGRAAGCAGGGGSIHSPCLFSAGSAGGLRLFCRGRDTRSAWWCLPAAGRRLSVCVSICLVWSMLMSDAETPPLRSPLCRRPVPGPLTAHTRHDCARGDGLVVNGGKVDSSLVCLLQVREHLTAGLVPVLLRVVCCGVRAQDALGGLTWLPSVCAAAAAAACGEGGVGLLGTASPVVSLRFCGVQQAERGCAAV
jgi:hypothetical protein